MSEETATATQGTDAPAITPASEAPVEQNNPTVVEEQSQPEAAKGTTIGGAEADKIAGEPAKGEGDSETPTTYSDFSLPEGFEMDANLLGQFSELAKEFGLNQEQAQKLIDLQTGTAQERMRQQQESTFQKAEAWAEELQNDPEFGGDKFEENVGLAALGAEEFFGKDVVKVLSTLGLGNYPPIVKGMNKLGQMLKEDNPGSGQPPGQQTSMLDRWYKNN